MIGWLGGNLKARDSEGRLVLEVGGVGYLVSVPLSVAADVAIGAPLELWIHTHVREDDLALFGFEDEVELQTFRALTAISGVGPKVALAVLGQTPPAELASAVLAGDIARLSRAKGVGKRLAERLAVELKGKLDFVPVLAVTETKKATVKAGRKTPTERVWDDLRSALANLEYRPKEIDAVLAQVLEELDGEPPEFSAALRKALAILRK